MRLGVRRVLAVTPELETRGDTSAVLALGAHAYELDADRAEIARAAGGTPTASPLFVGHDGVPYKRGYAAVGDGSDVAGIVAVEGAADYPAVLAAFRRSMIRTGVGALLAVLLLTVWISQRISRPVARLAEAAARLGRGDLDGADPDRDPRRDRRARADAGGGAGGAARARRAHADDAGRDRARGAQPRSAGSSCTPACCATRSPTSPSGLEEVARIEREVGHLKAVVTSSWSSRGVPARAGGRPAAALFEEIRELASVPAVPVEIGAPDGLAGARRTPCSCGARC
jgi:hypothetical protein